MNDENAIWSLPKFPFVVSGIPGNPSFSEASGLEPEEKMTHYRTGDRPVPPPIMMPGLKRGIVTLRKGVFMLDDAVWRWFDSIKLPTLIRSTIRISLLDQTGAARMIWTLDHAFPRMVSATQATPDGKQVAVQSLELAYETLSVTAA